MAETMTRPTFHELLVEELALWLRRQRKPKASSEVMAFFGTNYSETLSALNELVRQGVIVRTGLKRGSRYMHSCKGQGTAVPLPLSGRWHERVRDVAVELGTFRINEICAALPELSQQTIRRWLGQLVADGVLAETIAQQRGRPKVYEYVPPPSPSARAPGAGKDAGPRRNTAVAGTGRRAQYAGAPPEVREFLRDQESKGRQIKEQKHGYAVIGDNGEIIQAVARTPSDHRALKNAAAAIRRHERGNGDGNA
jgi:hypothetical protein